MPLHLRPRRFLRRLKETSSPANWLGPVQWILSRPLYRFRRFELKHVPKPQRRQALWLQIRQWSPYVRFGHYVVWDDEQALVWAWDADRLDADFAAQRLKPQAVRVIPEALLHTPLNSGLRLIACLDGVEGELWQADRPVHSRWWPAPPNESEWLNFQRDAGIASSPDNEVPVVQVSPLLQQPWAKAVNVGVGRSQSFPHEKLLVGSTVLALVAFTTLEAIQLIKTRQSIAQLNQKLAELDLNARPVLDARRQSLESVTRIRELETTNRFPPQLGMMSEVSKQLTDDGAYLREWDFQNGKLKLGIVSTAKLSTSSLVKRLQDVGWFANVQAAPSPDSTALALTMETVPRREIPVQTQKTPTVPSPPIAPAANQQPVPVPAIAPQREPVRPVTPTAPKS